MATTFRKDIRGEASSQDGSLTIEEDIVFSGDVTLSGSISGGYDNADAVAAVGGTIQSVSTAYAKTATGAQTLLAANAAARRVFIHVLVTEEFADGDGAQTVFIIGETDSTNKFMVNTALAAANVGTILVYAGTITAAKALLVTATAATGTGTGAITVTAMAMT